MPLSPRVYTWLCGCFAALGSILFGYDLGVISSILPGAPFLAQMGPNASTAHPTSQGFIVSLLVLGALFGSVPAGLLGDFLGRRKAIMGSTVVFLVGSICQTAAYNLATLMVGRFLAGFGIGMLATLAPIYQSEIAHPSIRGKLITLTQFFLGIGAFIASWIGYGAFFWQDQRQWRVPFGIQAVPAVPLFAFILFFPESPRWLASKGRNEEALANLARLHAHGNTEDPFVVAELADINEALKREAEIGESWGELFFVPSNFRRLALGFVLQFSVQMTGVSAIQYYSPEIFSAIGFQAHQTLLVQSINSVIALIGEACCVLFVDALGRRRPLIWANALDTIWFIVATAIMANYNNISGKVAAGWIFILMTWAFNFCFSAAIGPLSWAYPAEIFNTRTRAKGTSLTSMSAWASNFMIAEVTPVAFGSVQWRYMMVFAICSFTNAVVMWAFYPETAGRRLEEMDDLVRFHGTVGMWTIADCAQFETAPAFVAFNKEATVIKKGLETEELLTQGLVFNFATFPILILFQKSSGARSALVLSKANIRLRKRPFGKLTALHKDFLVTTVCATVLNAPCAVPSGLLHKDWPTL
ncbi:general substrate transporter [Calocera viscosa TUFC12733]|uniref:General substrate transporter n=1 Tax=Calocera viscosa (strain TUFC12733) TaxID=1330018 RepID=A0A167Q602_CALVF|nr:general substrate transporter [Calocera viscosa TUFC12733]